MTRVIGLDHGKKRIGIAVGDTETAMAFARPALRRQSMAVDLDTIAALVRDEDAELVVVGLPRNMDGSEGPQAAAARDFGERLAAIGLQVAYMDERLTSWQAAEELAAEGREIRRDSGELDSAAARLILQEYLDLSQEPE
ncbi:MAG TPA: Holliday junction resolvase RuvX [Candidatus Limnocylindria bacterium]|nr:Holliday junction resolvase RuvX [Candidatus Limnocylindria bacterium]